MKYEITILEPEQNNAEAIAGVRATVEKWADIHTLKDDGVKRLCYPINLKGVEHNFARYIYITATINGDDYLKLGGELVRDDRVLRYLIVKER